MLNERLKILDPRSSYPADQAFPPPRPTQSGQSAQTRGLPATSSGEIQPRSGAGASLGVTATGPGSASSVQSTGEAQFKNILVPEVATATCRGLPANVHAGSARPGGLAADVIVK